MYVQLTLAALGLLTIGMIVLRFFWRRLPDQLQTVLLAVACSSAVLPILSMVSGWSIRPAKGDALLHWISVAGYELVLVRFSLIRPQWLTSFCAVVLLLPMFGSSLVFPLVGAFHPAAIQSVAIDKNHHYERMAWDTTADEVPGFEIVVYRTPSFAPFLKHKLQRSAFNSDECVASEASASLLPDGRNVLFRCPAKPGGQAFARVLPIKK
jgi:hypothetical protein